MQPPEDLTEPYFRLVNTIVSTTILEAITETTGGKGARVAIGIVVVTTVDAVVGGMTVIVGAGVDAE